MYVYKLMLRDMFYIHKCHTHIHTHTHTYIYNGIYHKELVHAIMEVDKSKVCRVNWQTRDPGKLIFQFKSKDREKTNAPA